MSQLKDGKYVSGLLDYIFLVLELDGSKAVDASKFDITTYSADTEESPRRDLQWLVIHLYYLCLKHLPSLAKAWWIDLPGRQTAVDIETWTEKYVSPSVISDELNNVTQWVESATKDDDEKMKVKISKKVKEIIASYEVDEQVIQIVIKLPGGYPLQQATVEGLNRVAIDEKKWRSWLLSTQGVIKFSVSVNVESVISAPRYEVLINTPSVQNGSIIDGLVAWRKNVSGALKGQTECAICYSIISGDKQLPSKKCSTCKNLFHSSRSPAAHLHGTASRKY